MSYDAFDAALLRLHLQHPDAGDAILEGAIAGLHFRRRETPYDRSRGRLTRATPPVPPCEDWRADPWPDSGREYPRMTVSYEGPANKPARRGP